MMSVPDMGLLITAVQWTQCHRLSFVFRDGDTVRCIGAGCINRVKDYQMRGMNAYDEMNKTIFAVS